MLCYSFSWLRSSRLWILYQLHRRIQDWEFIYLDAFFHGLIIGILLKKGKLDSIKPDRNMGIDSCPDDGHNYHPSWNETRSFQLNPHYRRGTLLREHRRRFPLFIWPALVTPRSMSSVCTALGNRKQRGRGWSCAAEPVLKARYK